MLKTSRVNRKNRRLTDLIEKYSKLGGWPPDRVVKFVCSAMAGQGFAGSDPGPRQGTTHQAMLRWHPTCHNWKDPQL